jgi:hypothetical protein
MKYGPHVTIALASDVVLRQNNNVLKMNIAFIL